MEHDPIRMLTEEHKVITLPQRGSVMTVTFKMLGDGYPKQKGGKIRCVKTR